MSLLAAITGYLIGALPMGYIFLWLFRRQDITQIGSGRTGGTNAMRAGGVWLGILTGLADLFKGFLAVQCARWLAPDLVWTHVLTGFFVVLGHNWSIWLYLFTRKFSAGAGAGPNIGVAMAFWPWILIVVIPLILFFVFFVGYASLATLSSAVAVVLVFAARTLFEGSHWEYIVYGLLTLALISWALRPNIQRLIAGNERRVNIFGKRESK